MSPKSTPEYCEHLSHLFYMIMPSLEERQALIAHLKDYGIQSVFNYLPLHLSDIGKKFGGKEGDCPITEYVSDRLIRLPFFSSIGVAELHTVVSAIRSFR